MINKHNPNLVALFYPNFEIIIFDGKVAIGNSNTYNKGPNVVQNLSISYIFLSYIPIGDIDEYCIKIFIVAKL